MARLSPLKSGIYLKKRDLFFDESKLLFAQVTDMFDFIWPTVAGMWNLRWQVNGYLAVNANAGVDELKGKFTKGSGGEGANIKRACQEFTWDEQKEQFATFLLVNSFAFYESWITNVLKVLGHPSKQTEKALQYPSSGPISAPTGGIQFAINNLTNPHSSEMRDLFYPSYLANPKNGLLIIENLIGCYRYFKELRNCIMHSGSIADIKLMDAYSNYMLLTPASLNAIEVPVINAPILNKPVNVNLRGVVGFYDILLKLVATIDAELSVSEKAAHIVISKSRKINGRPSLSTESSKKNGRIKSVFGKLHMPKPLDLSKAEDFLKRNSLIS